MSAVPFALRRPWLLVRDILVNRDRPDLERLREVREPDRFVWGILPHAARTFSACIAMLPARAAKAAAVGYLYCRVLDTYEDLHPDAEGSERCLREFAARLAHDPLPPAPPIPATGATDERDRSHILLVERCDLVDRVFETLDETQRGVIRELVTSMAEGMCWSSETFRNQGGVLRDKAQLDRYCRNVLGYPVVFTVRLFRSTAPPPELHEDSMAVGEMVQIANITRDIEKDLRRGVAYHPALEPWLGGEADPAVVRDVRRDLLTHALRRADRYHRMVEGMQLPQVSLARASAVLMLLFTSRYFRSCGRRVGISPWRGPENTLGLFLQMLPAVVSRGYTRRLLGGVEGAFLRAAEQA